MAYELSDEERALFRAAMKDVQPLGRTSRVAMPQSRRHIKRVRKRLPVEPEIDIVLTDISDYEEETVSAAATISFMRQGVQTRYFQQLQRGQLAIEAELDLHGLTVDQAKDQLLAFLPQCVAEGIRVIRIIHGKGIKPRLKNKVNTWLRQLDIVLAFVSTVPKDGGTGAVYVLLKQRRKLLVKDE